MNEVMELAIDPGQEPGSYVVRVIRSLSGDQPAIPIVLDVDALVTALPALESSVLASSASTRRVMTERESAIQSVGSDLFGAVFTGAVESAYRASVAVAAERGRPLQIALRLNGPGLAALPWETLFDPTAGVYLSRREPLVRWVPGPHDPQPLLYEPPLRILGMIAAPRGLPLLDVEAEKERLEEALREQLDSGRVELTWLDDASWHGVQGKLLAREWHVLHFVGHGGYDLETDEGMLALVGADGRPDFVAASRLADLLDEADPPPRLVVLNSCQSGAAGITDLLSGTAAALVHSGIHAVAAMQFAITDGAAIAFSRAFYASIAGGRPVGEAVRSGRIGILGTGRDTLEWVTPVLYLRGDDTRLLEPGAAAPAGPTAAAAAAAAASTPAAADPSARGASVAASEPTPAADAGPAPASETEPPPSSPPVADPTPTPIPTRTPRPGGRRGWIIAAIVAAVLIAGAALVLLLPRGAPPPPTDSTSAEATASETSAPATTTPAAEPVLPLAVRVPVDEAWTATGVRCDAGDTLVLTATGIALHAPEPDATVTPDGLTEPFFHQFNVDGLPDANTASLIGSLDREGPFFVGSAASYACPRAGELFLGINDEGLEGNSGSWTATIDRVDAE